MKETTMTSAIQQRTISVSLIGTTSSAAICYTYVRQDGENMKQVSHCDMTCNTQTNYLFVLDAASTANGWTITNFTPTAPTILTAIAGPNQQSYCVTNPNPQSSTTYAFLFTYTNVNGSVVSHDPQIKNNPK